MERTITFAGDPNIGVFARVLGDIAIVPPDSTAEFKAAVRDALGVTLVETTIQGSPIIGSLVAGNSRGVVVSGLATEEEIGRLAEHRKVLLLTEPGGVVGPSTWELQSSPLAEQLGKADHRR
jgi:translation initiation factor 6